MYLTETVIKYKSGEEAKEQKRQRESVGLLLLLLLLVADDERRFMRPLERRKAKCGATGEREKGIGGLPL